MVVDRVADERPDRRLQRPGREVELVGGGPGAAVDVLDQDLGEDGVLVREVLVQRADGDAGALGDAVGGAGGAAVLGET
jgi:hypothetical protein